MSSTKNLSYQPTDGLTYDTADEKYWQRDALDKEVERAFEICHGCRMCFKYCEAFPSLFDIIDNKHDGNVGAVTEAETNSVMDQCFQCKLCEVQCPYTPRDEHEFQLDFPALVHRWDAQRTRREGSRLRDRVLSNPDQTAKMARASLGAANVANKMKLPRWALEKTAGIHREKLLPDFASETFEAWARKDGRLSAEPGGEVVLFQTCYVQNNEPSIGRDVLEVLEKNQVDVRCVAGLACCGMPAWEQGRIEQVRKQAATNLDLLLPYVDAGAKILAINPTCSMMLRRELPRLVDPARREDAERIAAAVMDPSEFLWSIRKEDRFCTDFRSSPSGPIAYHAPCHLRAQGVGFKGRDLLKKLPDVTVSTTMECCGHDGTFAMKVEGFEASARVGKKSFDGMNDAEARVWSTDCPLAALQFEQHAGTRPLHPMTILARAYRGESFD
jgi:glycerol-3-phosphate dehydrogenase subunit C